MEVNQSSGLIIDIVNRSNKLLKRHKIQQHQITIGRGFNNDIILDDPYVCPHHLSLFKNQDDVWKIKDNFSLNGSFDEQQQRISGERSLQSGDVFSIGKSFLRVWSPEHAVAPSLKLKALENLINRISQPLLLFMLLCVVSLSLGFQHYIITPGKIALTDYLTSVVTTVLVIMMWPLLWGLIARSFKREARLGAQVAISLIFYLVFILFVFITNVIGFNTFNFAVESTVNDLGMTVLLFMVVWTNLYVAFNYSPLKRTLVTASVTVITTVVILLFNSHNSNHFDARPAYNSTLLPPEFLVTDPISVNNFIDKAPEIFKQATEQLNEEKTRQTDK